MEISGKGVLNFHQETPSLIGNQTNHRTNMFLPYQSNSCYESGYECICIVINAKQRSVPLNILSSVVKKKNQVIRENNCANCTIMMNRADVSKDGLRHALYSAWWCIQ